METELTLSLCARTSTNEGEKKSKDKDMLHLQQVTNVATEIK